jgi:hypothetical protein
VGEFGAVGRRLRRLNEKVQSDSLGFDGGKTIRLGQWLMLVIPLRMEGLTASRLIVKGA